MPSRGRAKRVRPGTRDTRWPAARNARARLRPRLPRPATTRRSGVLAGARACGRGLGLFGREDLVELFAVDRLDDLQPLDHRIHLASLLGQDAPCGLVAVVDDAADLLVDDGGHLLGVVPLLAEVAAEEDELLFVAHRDRAELLRHAPLRHHTPRKLRRLLDVVLRPGGDVLEHDLLRHAATHDAGDLVFELVT